jgi:phage recombination protein Bet
MSTTETHVITAAEVQAQESERRSLVAKFAAKYGLETNKMMATLRATAFRGEVSNEQMAALLIVADQHGLNPWTKEIYAFPSRQGIVPVVSVDGWARIINEHPQFDGMDFELTKGEKEGTEAYTCTMYRKDRSHPVSITEYMAECKRPTDPWSSHPLRMLRHKAMIQCARLAFSFAGIYDPDEAERVLAAEDAIDVTPANQSKSGKLSPKKIREIAEGLLEAEKNQDGPGLLEIWRELTNDQKEFMWGEFRSYERSALKKAIAAAEAADCGMQLDKLSESTLREVAKKGDLEALTDAMLKVTDAYAANEQEVPGAVQSLYQDLRAEIKGKG